MSITRNSWSFVSYSNVRSYTREEAVLEASKWGLQDEVTYLMDNGYSPNEALSEWDIL
jgi:hypothetical protein